MQLAPFKLEPSHCSPGSMSPLPQVEEDPPVEEPEGDPLASCIQTFPSLVAVNTLSPSTAREPWENLSFVLVMPVLNAVHWIPSVDVKIPTEAPLCMKIFPLAVVTIFVIWLGY